MHALSLGAALMLAASLSGAAPKPEQLLPATTTEFVAIPDLTRLEQTWSQTQLARLLSDPSLKPFLDDVAPHTKGANYLIETIGVQWETVRKASSGDLGWAVVLLNGKDVAHILTLDMKDREAAAKAFFLEIGAKLQAQNAKLSTRQFEGMSLVVADLPNQKQIIYGIKDGLMVCTDRFAALQGIMARWQGAASDSLANLPAFQKVVERTRPAAGEQAIIRWFFEPVARAEAQLIFQPELKKVRGDNIVQALRKEGVDGIKGVGGNLAFVSNGTDMLVRCAAWAPPPYRGAMRMARLPNETSVAPEPWVPAHVSTWATVSIDLVNALDAFETLFERFADEEAGSWKDILKTLKEDPNGPQVDIRREIFEQLVNRVTVINDATLPVSEKGERFLVGIPAKDAAAEKTLIEGLKKCFQHDRRVKKRDSNGALVWEYHPRAKKTKSKEPVVSVPSMAFTVAKGTLFLTTHADLLNTVLNQQDRGSLASSADYQAMMQTLTQLGMGASSSRFFGRIEPGARTTYEMMRAGRLDQVDSIYARILLGILQIDEEGKRLKGDGSKLPSYSQLTPYLGVVGSYSTTQPDGWTITGVTLKR